MISECHRWRSHILTLWKYGTKFNPSTVKLLYDFLFFADYFYKLKNFKKEKKTYRIWHTAGRLRLVSMMNRCRFRRLGWLRGRWWMISATRQTGSSQTEIFDLTLVMMMTLKMGYTSDNTLFPRTNPSL
jgi:hypothetical protein